MCKCSSLGGWRNTGKLYRGSRNTCINLLTLSLSLYTICIRMYMYYTLYIH